MLPLEQKETPQFEDHGSVFRKSFLYSQGLPDIQRRILAWTIAKGYVSRDIPKEVPENVLALIPPRMHDEVSQVSVHDQIKARWKDFYDLRDQFPFISETELTLTHMMLQADLFYQIWKRPERPIEAFVDVDSFQDAHASFVRAFAINGRSTGSAGINDLFTRIATIIEANRFKGHSEDLPFKKMYKKAFRVSKFHGFLSKVSIADKLEMLQDEWESHHHGFDFYEESRLNSLASSSEGDSISN